MPRGDGTGPMGTGPRGGRGAGMGRGAGGAGPKGGAGRMGGVAAGPVGQCVCPKCNKVIAHERGIPCASVKCPDCGTLMTRKV